MANNSVDSNGAYQSHTGPPEMVTPDGEEMTRTSVLPPGSLSNNNENNIKHGGDAAPTSTGDQPLGEQQAAASKNSAGSLEETTPIEVPQVGKPQVIVRIRPSSSPQIEYNENNTQIFEVDRQANTVQIRVDREDRKTPGLTSKNKPPPGFIYFPADKILEDSVSQEDTFTNVAGDVVEKAMAGIPGMIVTIGPEMSGKSYTLFGLSGKYQNRGVAVRALEKMFDIKDRKQGDIDFKFGIGIIEVRRERIRDLLTLSSHEINEMGDKGPKGMYIEAVDCLEQALGLMLRASIGQKLIHVEPFERYHTIVYLEIVAVSPLVPEMVQYQSRITLAEIASAVYKMESTITPSNSRVSLLCRPESRLQQPQQQCPIAPPFKTESKLNKLLTQQPVFPSRKCCNPGQTTGPLAESIAVRRDVFALEQIFLRANEMNRIRKYFKKMENLGLSMIASEKKRLASAHHYRHNKLVHCLKDIMDSNMEIRIVLHVRPDKNYLKASLEAMRFAERARLVPSNLDEDPNKGKPSRTEEQILQEVIQNIAPELIHPVDVESLNSEKMKVIQEQAVHYFQNNIEEMKVCSKEKVKVMFENFRVLWNFLWELELNVTLRKAEEEMKQAMEKMSSGAAAEGGSGGGKRNSKRGSDFGKPSYEGGEDEDMEKAGNKKSNKRLKRDKDRKKKKEKQVQHQQDKRASSNEFKGDDKLQEVGTNDVPGGDAPNEAVDEQNGVASARLSQTTGNEDDEKPSSTKGETEVTDTSSPDTTTEQKQQIMQPSSTNVASESTKNIPPSLASVPGARESFQKVTSVHGGRESIKKISKVADGRESIKKVAIEENAATVGGQASTNIVPPSDVPALTAEKTQEPVAGDAEEHTIRSSADQNKTQGHPSAVSAAGADVRHNSIFFADGETFPEFKLSNFMGVHEPIKKQLTDEERAERAAEQEQQIAQNFEEMRKVARRQAIHLLRAGIKRPQWLSQF